MARLRDAGALPGESASAEVSLPSRITSARLTDLTETPDGAELDVADGHARVPVSPGSTVTVAIGQLSPVFSRISTAQTGANAAPERPLYVKSAPVAGGPGGEAEPVQPVFTRYWLHGKGPAPAGNLPVTVHLSPDRVSLSAPGSPAGRFAVIVACGPVGAEGEAILDVPSGLVVTCPDGTSAGPLRYSLPLRGYARWDLVVGALPGAVPGRYFLAARIGDDLGQVLEDAALVTIGEPPGPAPGEPRPDLLAALDADRRAQAEEVGVELLPATLELAPGESGTLMVRLSNRTAGQVRGELQFLSPFGGWPGIGPSAWGFTADPGQTVVETYLVTVPATARPGSQWWALAKVMYFGRVRYSDCAQVSVTA